MHVQDLRNDEYSLKAAQQTVEGIDLTEKLQITSAQMAYNATLSMGSNLIPLSILISLNNKMR